MGDFPSLGDSVAEQFVRQRFAVYDRLATNARLGYYGFGIAQLSASLLIALSFGFGTPRWLVPALGALVAFLEGARSLFRVQNRYLSYRAAAEQLRNEAWLFAQRAGAYAGATDAAALLAQRTVDISEAETGAWAAALRSSGTPQTDGAVERGAHTATGQG